MTRFLITLLSVAALAVAPAAAQDKKPADKPAADKPAAAPAAKSRVAVVTMDKGGEFTLEFFPAEAPKHVENFLTLAGKGFYDGQRVHRVEPGFVVQFGDPQSKTLPMDHPKMGTGGPGYSIKAEFTSRKFDRGILGMARSQDPDSGGSQVYVMLGPAYSLNNQYTAFGRVASGMEVVDKIRVGDRIKSIKVVTK